MARKAQSLRLAQAKQTLDAYSSAGLATVSQARFMSDMIRRMERNKYPTKRQREWLDSIIEEGVPTPKGDQEYIAKIDKAISTDGIDFAQILVDFRGKLQRGWDLSAKQKSWCDSLLEKAEAIREGTFWKPDAELTERIKLAVSCKICYNATYWHTHSGGARAMGKAEAWLAGDMITIDEWTVNKLFKSVTGRLREMENVKFGVGSLAYCPIYDKETGQSKKLPGVVVSAPKPTPHGVSFDVLVNGNVVSSTRLSKRRG